MASEGSGFRFYSLALVTENKKPGDHFIKAWPTEHLPFFKGNVGGTTIVMKSALPDAKGKKSSTSAEGGAEIIAKWIPFSNPNRATPPDVVEGETVMLFAYADTNEYFWCTTFFESGLRGLEDVIFAFSNLPGGRNKDFDPNSSYYFRVNTRDKLVHLHTSDNDGEVAKYDLMINTKTGVVTMSDNYDNSFTLDSAKGKLNFAIFDEVNYDTKKFKVNASESITLSSPQTTAEGGKLTAQSAMVMKNGFSAVNESGGSAGQIEGGMNIKGETTVDGNVKATGEVHGSNIGN